MVAIVFLDFRKLNKITVPDAYHLPKIDSILHKLRKAKYISKLDVYKGFLNIPLEKNIREKTAFVISGRGLYQFVRMPLGLTNAPATFQRLIDALIGPDMEPYVFAYLDEIIIVTETFSEHLQWLKIVLEKIKKANLNLNIYKCEFCCHQVEYLGYMVNIHGLLVDPDKTEPISTILFRKTLKNLGDF